MAFERGQLSDSGRVGAHSLANQGIKWRCQYQVDKRWIAPDGEHDAGDYETIYGEGNTLANGGADVIWKRLIVLNPTTSATGAVLQGFSSGTSRIGVGISSAAAAASQTDLQATAPNKTYDGMESGYPTHTTGTSTAARSASWRSLFTTAQANFAWKEWALFNSTGASRRMLNRKVQSLGTKTSAAQWTFTVTLTLS
jgi:hypothetical protein